MARLHAGSSSESLDVAIVGGGIIGLAAAHRLLSDIPSSRIAVIEKEETLAAHQTGHNSGVIHSGIYYRPGSAKARTCVRGAVLMKDFCARHGIPFETCGKVVVAVEESEIPRLEELHRRGVANGVPGLELIGPERLREIEPHAAGIRALWVPGAAIVDYRRVAGKLAELVESRGGKIWTGARVERIREGREELLIETGRGAVAARLLLGCAGLHSDRLARLEGGEPEARIVPFRGEYYDLAPERWSLVRGLIYPVPDPGFPFLGVHFTRRIGGGVEAGPNAVLAFSREGYRKRQIRPRDLAEVLLYPGFWRLASKYWRTGLGEMVRSCSKRAFVRALAKLVPEIRAEDVRPGGSGVRAQALSREGSLLDDFLILERPRALHVLNAPSPAATASLAIAEEIARLAVGRLPPRQQVAGTGGPPAR